MPEAAGLFESLSGQEFLELSGRLHDVEEDTLQGRIKSVLERFDLTKEDAADDLLFNEVIWRSVRGPDSAMPAPVRAAFVFPHLKTDSYDKE